MYTFDMYLLDRNIIRAVKAGDLARAKRLIEELQNLKRWTGIKS